VDETAQHIRLRQHDPSEYQGGSFRTIALSERENIKAVIGRPWIAVGNPHPKCVLFEMIHKDWALHRHKHQIYAQLAKAKGSGSYSVEMATRRFKPLITAAAKTFRRQHKIRTNVSELFPFSAYKLCAAKLIKEFGEYWKKGQLDQYIARANWKKRQEK
jgi:hypothetical protein